MNDDVLVFVALDFEETITFAVQSTPGVNPVILILLSAVIVEFVKVKTVELSKSFITEIAIVTPATGSIELIFILIILNNNIVNIPYL